MRLRLAAPLALAVLLTARAHAQSAPPDASGAAGQDLGDAGTPGRPAAQVVEPTPAAPVDDEPTMETSSEASETLTGAELEALGLDEEGQGVDTDLHFSGFADFTSFVPIKPRGAAAVGLPRHQTFYVGNINLYLSKNLSESFRTMGEVRLTYLPNGSMDVSPTGFDYQSSQALDYANTSQPTRWGGIVLQRIYLEWTLHRLAVVRGGQFLTPYGIWNVDHGSPAYIPINRPYAINNLFFPERQTGLEMFGRWDATNQSTLGYHLTLSNGTGPISEYKDLDRNKAIGGRLYWEHHGVGYLRVGASGYYGRETASTVVAKLTPTAVEIADTISMQYDNLALAADVLFKLSGLHLQAEWVSQQRRYTRLGRVSHDISLGPVAKAASADSLSWACYAILAYQFGWYGITPYFMQEFDREVRVGSLVDAKQEILVSHFGLDLHPVDAVTFKMEYARISFLGGGLFFKYPLNVAQLQAAWAF